MVPEAKRLAAATGFSGSRFPWQSAVTGAECSPRAYNDSLYWTKEMHITPDIVMAHRLLYNLNKNDTWLRQQAWPLISGACEFLASFVVPDPTTGNFTMLHVLPTTEVGFVKAPAYSTAATALSLQFCVDSAAALKITVPSNWSDIAARPYLPLNDTAFAAGPVHQVYQPYSGGKLAQAGVALLQYPLQFPMDDALARRDLQYYGTKFNFGMMFFGRLTYAINWLRFGSKSQADEVFDLAFFHQVGPWNVWRELGAPGGVGTGGGAVNFLTGAGAFLQSFLFGYIGLQVHASRIDLNPKLPAHAANASAAGIAYRSCNIDVFVNASHMQISGSTAACGKLHLTDAANGSHRMVEGRTLVLPVGRATIARRTQLKSDDDQVHDDATTFRSRNGNSCRIFNDTDFDGHDLKMGETATVELCCALCDATPGCGYWTFMPPKTCFMKTSNAGRRVLATHTSGCKSMSCALPAPAPPAPPPPPPAPPPMPQLLAFPLPFPLPARAKFGRCPGAHPPLDARIAAGCAATMVLRDDFTVVCDPKCTPSCRTSALFRTVVAHFEQLLTGANTSSASPLSDAGLPRADRRATAPLHGVLGSVSVCVRSASEELGPSTNESYSLRVPAGAANSSADQVVTLTAATIFGARHGLESFFQLLDVRSQGQPLQLRSAPVIIDDEPRFHYRGLMIDSSRHFLPLHHIKHIIATAAQVKLNLIHWHLTDTQSFSTGSAAFPELAAKGAFPNGYSGQTGNSPAAGIAPNFFSPSQMREVVQFAKEHGVRVMPEWGKSSVPLICAHLAR